MRADGLFGRWFGEKVGPGTRGLPPNLIHFLAPAEHPPLRKSVVSGMKAGVLGAAVMTATLAYIYGSQGGNPVFPLRLMVFHLFGGPILAGSAVGLLLGLIMSAIWGIALGGLFGLLMAKLVGRVSMSGAIGVGGIYGLLVWIVGQYVVMSYIAPQSLLFFDQHALALAHVTYGVSLGIFGRAYRIRSWLLRHWRF